MQIDLHQLESSLRVLDPEFPFIRKWVNHLIAHKGLPGFVETFKSLKSWALQIIAENKGYKKEWFRIEKYRGYIIPKVYKQLFRQLVDLCILTEGLGDQVGSVRRDFRSILSAINIYHLVKGPYRPDVKLGLSLAAQEEVIPSGYKRYETMLAREGTCFLHELPSPSKLGTIRPTGQSLALSPGKNGDWGDFVSSQAFQMLAGFDHVLTRRKLERRIKTLTPTHFMGNLTVIGDTGGKTRIIMVADPVLQGSLVPLKEQLLEILKDCPTDCLWQQSRGVDFLKLKQKNRIVTYSIDLKDATWNFPRALQESVLKSLKVSKEIRNYLFRTLAHDPLRRDLISIRKGQAMGLGPSFPLFSLTHNLLLLSMCRVLGIVPVDSFRILGDDVILANKRLYELYQKFLQDFEIPISVNKTFVSPIFGEFAGRIIFRGMDITPIKWKPLDWNSVSTLYWDYRHVFGKRIHRLINGKRAYASLQVLGPLPKRVGGLNLNQNNLGKDTPTFQRLRAGVIESYAEGLVNQTLSFGVTRIPDVPLNVGVYHSLVDTEALRSLSTLLNSESITDTVWGLLPTLTPNPSKFLNQVGIKKRLLPTRVLLTPDQGFRFRFKRSKVTDWKDLYFNLQPEVKLVSQEKSRPTEESKIVQSVWFE